MKHPDAEAPSTPISTTAPERSLWAALSRLARSWFSSASRRLGVSSCSCASQPNLPEAPGPLAEELAARFLVGRGLKLLTRNHRCRGGEVDLILKDGATVVFVEVRLRSDADHGGAGASITPAKRKRLVKAARHWLAGKAECPCRFDCVLFERPEADSLQWLKGAFDAN